MIGLIDVPYAPTREEPVRWLVKNISYTYHLKKYTERVIGFGHGNSAKAIIPYKYIP